MDAREAPEVIDISLYSHVDDSDKTNYALFAQYKVAVILIRMGGTVLYAIYMCLSLGYPFRRVMNLSMLQTFTCGSVGIYIM